VATTQHSIRTTKTFPYRGDPVKQFSNRYYFDGDSPGDATAWHTLMDALVALEKTIYTSLTSIIRVDGYDPGSEVSVASKTYSTPGTLAIGAASYVPGDCAVVLRMATTKKSTKNHTVYVHSYFHGALKATVTGVGDDLFAAQKTAVEAYGTNWHTGFSAGGRTYIRTTPDGHLVTGRVVDQFIGHRDFPR
jgi:hypothetical protein